MTVTPRFQSPAQTSAFSSRLTFPCLLGTFALMSDKHPCSSLLALILISINGNYFLPVTQAKNLGVLLSSLSLSPQSDPTSKSYWLSLQNTSRIRSLGTISTTTTPVQVTIISHMEYCNILLSSAYFFPCSFKKIFIWLCWVLAAAHGVFFLFLAFGIVSWHSNS